MANEIKPKSVMKVMAGFYKVQGENKMKWKLLLWNGIG